MIKTNKSLFQLKFHYEKSVLFEPTDMKKYRSTVNNLNLQFRLEMTTEKNLYVLDPMSFVLQSSSRVDNLGQIIWASKNTMSLLEIDEKYLMSLTINSFLPREVAQVHGDAIREFLQYSKTRMINKITNLWIINHKNKLTAVKLSVKLFIETSGISFFSYMKCVNDNQPVFLNKIGEVSSFGNAFAKITGLSHSFVKKCPNVSLLFFMPQMLALFLSDFYGIKDFKLLDANKIDLETTYFIVFKDIRTQLLNFSKHVSPSASNIKEYSRILIKHISNLHFEDLSAVYKIKIQTSQSVINRNKIDLNYWVMNILEYQDVTLFFTKKNFQTYFMFLEKINFDEKVTVSIESYTNRKQEQQLINQETSEFNIQIMKKNTNSNFNKIQMNRKNSIMFSEKEIGNTKNNTNLKNYFPKISNIDEKKRNKILAQQRFNSSSASNMHECVLNRKFSDQRIADKLEGEKGLKLRNLIIRGLMPNLDYKMLLKKGNEKGNDWIDVLLQFERKNKMGFHSNVGIQIGFLKRTHAF